MRLASYWIPVMDSAHKSLCESQVQATELASDLMQQLDQVCTKAKQAGFTEDNVENALYAIVAWIDELSMSIPWHGVNEWRLSPLQKHYFSTTRAGVGFYDRLNNLDPLDTQVKEVYALMLLAGFQGKYNHGVTEELLDLRKTTLQEVAESTIAADVANTSVGLFPKSLGTVLGKPKPKTGPGSSIIMLIVLPLLILIALYFYLDFQVHGTVSDLIKSLRD